MLSTVEGIVGIRFGQGGLETQIVVIPDNKEIKLFPAN